MIWMRLRCGCSSRRDSSEISRPASRMPPEVGSISRTMQRATVDLPDPLSPTMPSVRPFRKVSVISWAAATSRTRPKRSEEHTSELQSHVNLVCRLLLEKKKKPGSALRHLLDDDVGA